VELPALADASRPPSGAGYPPASRVPADASKTAAVARWTDDWRRASGDFPKVLLVEDSPDSREMLAEVLSLLGYQTRGAASAEEALALLADWRPDVILSDIGLPRIDGYELMRRIRRLPELSGVVALAVSGYGAREDREQALAAGFDGHITKPLDIAALDHQLRELLATCRPAA
jgi:CheY-like chemotaxis protein